MPLLDVQNLKTHYKTDSGRVKAADGISFTLDEGESVGIAGESGCGKTTVVMSLMRLVDHRDIVGGKIILDGDSILEMTDDEFRHLRWKKISLVSQAAMGALNPVFTIGWQIIEALREHTDMSKSQCLDRAKELLEQVGVDPSRVHAYPHELSGGMRQRAMIAMSLACSPKIVIADEMTTALDVVTQVQILKLFQRLQRELNLSVIAISHELAILGQICEYMIIMYAGKIVEKGSTDVIFSEPLHPYTQALLGSLLDIATSDRKTLLGIPGRPPSLLNPPPGCRFAPRCTAAKPVCQEEEPAFIEVRPKHYVACHLVK
ncbi:ABC transporter ATP-binding protein [Chloroflexota bacterium]